MGEGGELMCTGNFVEGVHAELNILSEHPGVVGLYPDLDVVVNAPLHANKHSPLHLASVDAQEQTQKEKLKWCFGFLFSFSFSLLSHCLWSAASSFSSSSSSFDGERDEM
jgi:hypothetical protein